MYQGMYTNRRTENLSRALCMGPEEGNHLGALLTNASNARYWFFNRDTGCLNVFDTDYGTLKTMLDSAFTFVPPEDHKEEYGVLKNGSAAVHVYAVKSQPQMYLSGVASP